VKVSKLWLREKLESHLESKSSQKSALDCMESVLSANLTPAAQWHHAPLSLGCGVDICCCRLASGRSANYVPS
jgi:hypothetical protein